MRLFIAIELPEKIREDISVLQKSLDSVQNKIKWVEKENIHLTMKFLGETDKGKTESIIKELEKINFSPFSVSVSSSGTFPIRGRPRVAWLGLYPNEEIVSLHRKIDDSLTKIGFRRDTKFSPHATIGRIKFLGNPENFSEIIKKKSSAISTEPFTIDEFILKKSTLTPQGPVYEDVSRFSASP